MNAEKYERMMELRNKEKIVEENGIIQRKDELTDEEIKEYNGLNYEYNKEEGIVLPSDR